MSEFLKEFIYPLGVSFAASLIAYTLSIRESKKQQKQQKQQQIQNEHQRLDDLINSLTIESISLNNDPYNKVKNKIITVKVGTIIKNITRFSELCDFKIESTRVLIAYRQAVTGLNLDEPKDMDEILKTSENLIRFIDEIEGSTRK